MLEKVGFVFSALVLSYLGVEGLRRWVERRHILDIPNERSSHARPTPRGGGLAIVVITLAGWLLYVLLNPEMSCFSLLAYTGGAVLVASISWLDDLHRLPNKVRFAAHCIGAILIIMGFGYWKTVSVPIFDNLHLGWWGLPITFFWIVGLTNAYNFMDGIDGIAGGQGVVAGLGWAVLGWLSDQPMIGALGLLLASTSLGFLGHNWPPARIFMGDVGSAFLGYNFAAIPVIAAQFDTRLPLAGIMIMWPFIFDTSFTLLRRLLKGENIFIAHRFHIYQRLVAAGYSHFFVTFLYSMMAMIGAIFAIAWFMRLKRSIIDGTLIIPFLCLILWVFVIRKERLRELKIKRIRE